MHRESSICCRCVAYFDGIVDPATVKAGKPAPDIFLAGAQLAGAEPVDCVGVEDAASGVEAIKAAGIVAVGLAMNRFCRWRTACCRAQLICRLPFCRKHGRKATVTDGKLHGFQRFLHIKTERSRFFRRNIQFRTIGLP